MEIMLNEYYACVSEFAEERDCATGNAFLNTVMMQYYNEADAYGCYSDVRRRYYKTLSPKFSVGCIYKCFTANSLIDDRGTAQRITGDNADKFIHIEFNIDDNARKFIEKLSDHSVKVTLEPNNLIILDKEKFEAIHDASSFNIAFKCNAIFWNGAFFTIGYLDDENSICEALQELWKKIRIKSRQCFTINQALRLRSVDTGRIPYYGSFYNDWGRYINRDWD
jgi:hypothetical protein